MSRWALAMRQVSVASSSEIPSDKRVHVHRYDIGGGVQQAVVNGGVERVLHHPDAGLDQLAAPKARERAGVGVWLKLKLSVLTLSQRLVTPRTPRISGATYSDCQRYPSTTSGVPSNNY